MQDLNWYFDTHWKTLKEAIGLDIPKFVQKVYQARSGRTLGDILPYNNYTAKKQPKPKLSRLRADNGVEYLQTVWIGNSMWLEVKCALQVLTDMMKKYECLLRKKNMQMKDYFVKKEPCDRETQYCNSSTFNYR